MLHAWLVVALPMINSAPETPIAPDPHPSVRPIRALNLLNLDVR